MQKLTRSIPIHHLLGAALALLAALALVIGGRLGAQAPGPQIAGPYAGSVSPSAPIALGAFDLALEIALVDGGGVLSATVDPALTQAYNGAPRLSGRITSAADAITPTFRLESEPFVATVSDRQVTRSFVLDGAIGDQGGTLSGTYTETIAGFTPRPLLVSGTFLLVSKTGVALEAQPAPVISSAAIWVDPPEPIAGARADVGITIQRSSGASVLSDIPLRLFLGDPANGGLALGETSIPFLEPGKLSSSLPLSWTPGAAGGATLYAQIDPERRVSGLAESGSVISRTVQVLAAPVDEQAPLIDRFVVAGGIESTAAPTITLEISVSDPAPGSGVDAVYVAEYGLRAGQWVPVQVGDWRPYTGTPLAIPWVLRPPAGARYIQAWARDLAGNITPFPARATINYTPASQAAAADPTIFLVALEAGQTLDLRLASPAGDADLYVWAPDIAAGPPVWASDLAGRADDRVRLTALSAGSYQIEVHAAPETIFSLATSVTNDGAGALSEISQVSGKPVPAAPAALLNLLPAPEIPTAVVDPDPSPGPDAPPDPAAEHRIFLPLLAE